jgi:hypothetical protein
MFSVRRGPDYGRDRFEPPVPVADTPSSLPTVIRKLKINFT